MASESNAPAIQSRTSDSQDDSQKTGNTSLTQPATQPQPLFSDDEKAELWACLLPFNPKHSRIPLSRRQKEYYFGRFAKPLREDQKELVDPYKISHSHCTLTWNGEVGSKATATVRDTSTNGTFIGRRAVGRDNSAFIQDGNVLSFGPLPPGSAYASSRTVLEDDGADDSARDNDRRHRYEFRFLAYEAPLTGLAQRYSIAHDQELGSGAFATVKQGLHRVTGLIYAIKMIKNKPRPAVSLNASDKQESLVWSYKNFAGTSEFEIMARLKHRNICQMMEFFVEENGDINIVLEYVNGGDLLGYVKSLGGKFSDDRVQHIAYQICDGAAYIHTQGVAHRDLKPENILVTTDNPVRVKIADFGLAKMLVGETELRTRCGTKPFCAPEILLGGFEKAYSLNVDSWSVGNIIYWMFVDRGAYNPETWVMASSGAGTAVEPVMDWHSLEVSAASSQAVYFVKRLLKLDPSKRLALMEALNDQWFAYYDPPSGRAPSTYPKVLQQEKKVKFTYLCLPELSESKDEIPGLSGNANKPPDEPPMNEATAQTPAESSMLSIEPVDPEESLGSNFSDMSIKDKEGGDETDTGEDKAEVSDPKALKRGHSQVSSASSIGGKDTAPSLTPTPQRPTTQPPAGNPRPLASRKKPRFDLKPS